MLPRSPMDDVIHPALLLSAHRGGGARREARMYGSRLVSFLLSKIKTRPLPDGASGVCGGASCTNTRLVSFCFLHALVGECSQWRVCHREKIADAGRRI